MQRGRPNVGRASVNLGGKKATRLSGAPQPVPTATRPQAATPNVPRAGSREIVNVNSDGLRQAGQSVGSPAEPAQHGSSSVRVNPA